MTLSVKNKGELGFAGLLLAVGVFVLIDTSTIEIPKAASNVGPRFFPYAVGALLTAAAAFVITDILRGNIAEPEDGELIDPSLPMNKRRVVLLILSIVAFGVLLDPAGYIIAAAVTFFGISTTLGARRFGRVAVGSVVLAYGIYMAFTRGLGIYLPTGILDRIV